MRTRDGAKLASRSGNGRVVPSPGLIDEHRAIGPVPECWPESIAEDYAALNTKIPDDFWHEMRDQHLVAANAPLPVDNLTRHGRLDIIKPRPAART